MTTVAKATTLNPIVTTFMPVDLIASFNVQGGISNLVTPVDQHVGDGVRDNEWQ